MREELSELVQLVWDREIELDVRAGKLDALAEQALSDHCKGRTRPL